MAGGAHAQEGPVSTSSGLLPATGSGTPDVRVGDLRDQLTTDLAGGRGAPPPPPNPDDRRYTITPQIGVSEEYSDNAGTFGGGTGRGRRGDFITLVDPSVSVSADSPRLNGGLTYAPEIRLYGRNGHQNAVSQTFSGRLLGTVLPQTLFLDLRGQGGLQSISGLQGPTSLRGNASSSRGNTVQQYTFSVSPYALHRFGPWGTAEIGASYGKTIQGTPQGFDDGLGGLGSDTASQDVTTTGGHLAFTTGEAFGRYNGVALASTTAYDGAGVLRGARRNIATLDSGYALTRTVTALVKLGWENIRYSGTTPLRIDDLVWDAGVRLLPNDQSTVTLRYGHHDGFNSLLVDAAYQPSARTRVSLRYSSGLSTQAEELQNQLATSDLDALGQPVDHSTGVPLLGSDNFFGAQDNLYKVRQLSVTGTLLLDRDVVSLNLNGQDRTLVSSSGLPPLRGFSRFGGFVDTSTLGSNQGLYGSLSWAHELTPAVSVTVFGQVGVLAADGPPKSTQHLVAGSVATSYELTPTLRGQAQYSYTRSSGGSGLGEASGSSEENSFLVGVVKSF